MRNSAEEQLKLIKLEELKKKTTAIIEEERSIGHDIYSEDHIETFSEDDEITAEEDAFMRGYLAA